MLPLDSDQRREAINTRQLHEAWLAARSTLDQFRGSMVWAPSKGIDYLLRSAYPKKGGPRRQTSLGPRSPQTEAMKRDFDEARTRANARFKALSEKLDRQAAINRVVGLGRAPLISARILRQLDEAAPVAHAIRVIGTHALYAYEAAAGVKIDSDLATTQDIDLLFDSRKSLHLLKAAESDEVRLLSLLRKVDRSFDLTPARFRAANDQGFMVDLIKPLRDPPTRTDRPSLTGAGTDLAAVEIEGLIWLENAPEFVATVIDERGLPLRMTTVDPRVFAIHKLWVSRQPSRDPLQRSRDAAQAAVVARLTLEHFPHLPFDEAELRMLPRAVVEAARPLFTPD